MDQIEEVSPDFVQFKNEQCVQVRFRDGIRDGKLILTNSVTCCTVFFPLFFHATCSTQHKSPFIVGRNRVEGVGPVAAGRPQGKPGAARLDGEKGGQNLRHRGAAGRPGRPTAGRQRYGTFGRWRWHGDRWRCDRCRWSKERERRLQLAVAVAISVLLHRTESSEGTAAKDEVQGHLRRERKYYTQTHILTHTVVHTSTL